jgi:hypothetical protein
MLKGLIRERCFDGSGEFLLGDGFCLIREVAPAFAIIREAAFVPIDGVIGHSVRWTALTGVPNDH